MYTAALTNVADTCVLGLKPGENWSRMFTSGRTKSKEACFNIIKRKERERGRGRTEICCFCLASGLTTA